jgi:hypothetical protein
MFHLTSTETAKKIELEGFGRPTVEPQELPAPVLVRRATASDNGRIVTLARLDDRRLPQGPFLVAELGGEAVAAMSLTSGTVVADPFRRTRDAADMLRLRAAQLAEQAARAQARERRAAQATPLAA